MTELIADFAGKTALITGAASGIGRGIAEAFAAAGIKLALGDVDSEALASVAGRLTAVAMPFDVADRTQWDMAVTKAESALGPIDILCNNAGVAGLSRPVDEIPIAEWRWLTEINLFGVVHGLQCVVPRMKARRAGHIVNTASIGGLVPLARFGEYMATKHAVVGLSGSLRLELAPFGIGVSVLCPGAVRTSLGENTVRQRPSRAALSSGRGDAVKAQAWRYIEPVEVGHLVLRGIARNQHFIFTHPENRAEVEAQAAAMCAGFDALEA
jgi:NAD(P)-dependent dehydrogenase (short-subunit alcohol dehydrogenase family)